MHVNFITEGKVSSEGVNPLSVYTYITVGMTFVAVSSALNAPCGLQS